MQVASVSFWPEALFRPVIHGCGAHPPSCATTTTASSQTVQVTPNCSSAAPAATRSCVWYAAHTRALTSAQRPCPRDPPLPLPAQHLPQPPAPISMPCHFLQITGSPHWCPWSLRPNTSDNQISQRPAEQKVRCNVLMLPAAFHTEKTERKQHNSTAGLQLHAQRAQQSMPNIQPAAGAGAVRDALCAASAACWFLSLPCHAPASSILSIPQEKRIKSKDSPGR